MEKELHSEQKDNKKRAIKTLFRKFATTIFFAVFFLFLPLSFFFFNPFFCIFTGLKRCRSPDHRQNEKRGTKTKKKTKKELV